jgi:hypothetical protein
MGEALTGKSGEVHARDPLKTARSVRISRGGGKRVTIRNLYLRNIVSVAIFSQTGVKSEI